MAKPGQTTVNLTKKAKEIRMRIAPGRTGLGSFLSSAIIYMEQHLSDDQISVLMRQVDLEDKRNADKIAKVIVEASAADDVKAKRQKSSKTVPSKAG
jgi:cyanate lyase